MPILCQDEIGRGGFKTTHNAVLDIVSTSVGATELIKVFGQSVGQPFSVVLKKMYKPKGDKATRYQAATELR